ncbi:MAG: FtsQ-type POTRA domain-containing protein [Desulfobacterales bacterium]
MGFKQTKRNHYKKSPYRKRGAEIRKRAIFCLKIILALSVMPAVSLFCIFGYDCLTQSDYFRAETIDVEGNQILSREEVIKEALVKPGDNIISVNLSMVRKRLMANTWIAEAEVERKIPSGIILRIKEHKPLAVLDIGKDFLLNENGEIFKEKTATDPESLPLVKGLKFSDLSINDTKRSQPFNAVMTVLKLGRKPESIVPNSSITRINVDREIGLTVFAFNKTIKLGYNNYPDKYERLEKVFYLAQNGPDFSDFETVDLNNLSRIVICPAAAPAEGTEEHKKEV